MTQPALLSCRARRRTSSDSYRVTCGVMRRPLCVIVVIMVMCGGTARAAITATGDVLPDPIVPFDDVDVGRDGVGSLVIDGGSTLESNYVNIGEEGIGFVTVTGPGSMWSNYGGNVGERGVGRMEVLDGAIVDASGPSQGLWIGEDYGGNGTVVVDGPGSVLRVDAPLGVGRYGVGLLQVSGGAIVDVPNGWTEFGAQSRVEFDGGLIRTEVLYNEGTIVGHGTLQLMSSQTNDNRGRIESGAGQRLTFAGSGSIENFGVIEADGSEIEFANAVYSRGDGNGTGEIVLRDGVLRFSQVSGEGLRNESLLMADGGTNHVYGSVRGANRGTMLVTNDSTLTFHDGVTWDSTSEMIIDAGSTARFLTDAVFGGVLTLSIGAEDAPTPVQTVGETQLHDTALRIRLAEAYSPQVGDIFPLVNSSTITSAPYMTELPALPFGMMWEMDRNSSSIQLRILATPDGDYNGDGTVDASDYTVWRDTLGSSSALAADGDGSGMVDQNDYIVWKDNFGATASSSPANPPGAATLAAVPEPATGLLLLIGAMLLARRRS